MRSRLVTGAVLAAVAAAPAAASADLRVRNTLEFTRPDGTAVVYPPDVSVWCGRWERDVPVRSVHVLIGGLGGRLPYWHLRAVVADVRRDRVVELPHSFVWNRPSGALLFATDGTNELSTQEEEARGRIVFERVRCGRQLTVRFRMDGRLGSEFFEGEELTVRGSFRARTR